MSDEALPKQARVMIIGGHVIGRPVACHLTLPGWRDGVPRYDPTGARVRA